MTGTAAATPVPAAPTAPRIKSLTLRHFKAISGELVLPLNGKNLALLGENGSGKTTLSRGLVAVMDASRRSSDEARRELFERCQDVPAAVTDGYVKLELTDGSSYTLHEDGRWLTMPPRRVGPGLPPLPVPMSEAAKAKRLLDYKALLRTYFLQETPVDLFDLLLGDVLYLEENPFSRRTFGEDWKAVVAAHNRKPRTDATARALFEAIGPLNSGLDAKRQEIRDVAQDLIHYFDPELSFNLEYGPIMTGPRTEPVPKGYVHLKVRHKGRDIAKHTDYLNEARLSALALCLHFAVLKTMPTTPLKVLILDDVLLGLDVENRLPVLRLLEEHFEDWQTLMLTYDSIWFDMIQQWGESKNWEFQKIHRFSSLLGETTLRELNDGLVGEARRQLRNGDLSNAANTARSAAESILKRYFYKSAVELPYKKKQKEYSFEDFWQKACNLEQSSGTPYIDDLLKRRLQGARALVLNPASHDPTIPLTTREVHEAIEAVKDLAAAFGIQNP